MFPLVDLHTNMDLIREIVTALQGKVSDACINAKTKSVKELFASDEYLKGIIILGLTHEPGTHDVYRILEGLRPKKIESYIVPDKQVYVTMKTGAMPPGSFATFIMNRQEDGELVYQQTLIHNLDY